MKRPVLVAIVVVALLAALGIGGWYWWQQQQAKSSSEVVVSGTVDADDVQIASLVGGRITAAKVKEGDVVKAGQVLYVIDNRALKLQVDQAKSGVKAAKAAYQQAKDDNKSSADKAAARAKWEQAVAAQHIAEVQLTWATLTAPSNGVVTAVAATTGETASTGRTLATIMKSDSAFIRAYVPEPQIGKVAIGQTAKIETDSGTSVDGKVTFIASKAEFTPSNVETKDQRSKLVYEVRVKPSTLKGLTPGMPVTVTLGQ